VTDLFGNAVVEKRLTSTQRIATRQAAIMGRDLYTTRPADIQRFLDAAERDGLEIPHPIWEPAAGLGDISKVLKANGYMVRSTDLYPYRDDEIDVYGPRDFLLTDRKHGERAIFTNPPFNMQEAFLLHALTFGTDVIFFVRLSFLSSQGRYRKIYSQHQPAYAYVYTGRAQCHKDGYRENGRAQNMVDYCVIWYKPPYRGDTKLRWIE